MKRQLSSLAISIFLVLSSLSAQQRFTLNGSVTDSVSGEALVAVNIRIAGTSRGTVSNSTGNYSLALDPGNQTLIFSLVGYQPDTLRLTMTTDLTRSIKLVESPVQVPEVIVSAEDPAIEIIRKAIAHKRVWMDKLKTYSFEAFTRQVLRSDTSIASITESYSTGYMQAGDTLREVVKQKRQTQNIPLDQNAAAVRSIINFNEDRISLFQISVNNNSSSYTFVGPTAPDALDYYDYKLIGTSTVNGVEIYKIQMIPKSRTKPLFNGIITIADETFAVMGVDVNPNETFAIPFIKDIHLQYRQQFSLYNDVFWMPTDSRITGSLTVSFIGFSLPKIGIDQISAITDYKVNVAIPDSVLKKPRLAVDSSAATFDSTFWKQNDVLPLTTEEQTAYQSLDSTKTLDKQFEPKGPLASLSGDNTETFLNYIDARFNRVEGFFFGGKYEYDSLPFNSSARAAIGYGFSDTTVNYTMGATIFTSKERTLGFGADYFQKTDHIPDEGYYAPLTIALMSLIDKDDYRDYFLSKGWQVFTTYKPTKTITTGLSFHDEKETSMGNNTSYSLFAQSQSFRLNPQVNEGNMHSVELNFRLGEEAVPLGLVTTDAFELAIEHSSPSFTGGDFNFTRYNSSLQWNTETFATDLLFPPRLSLKLSGGTSSGTLPLQRLFSLESRASGYAAFGVLHGSQVKEFEGTRYVMLNVEHNFRTLPFLWLNIPFLYKNSIELIVFGSVAKTWMGTTPTTSGWYSEAGIGFNRIFDVLRIDATYRFAAPSGVYFSVSVANLF